MEAHSYKFEPTSYLSPLYENASCAITKGNETYYRPMNSINWDTDEITTLCAKDANIQSEKTKTMRGSFYNQGWALNSELHRFFVGPSSIQCDNGNNPILSLKWETKKGKFEPVYQCPADDSLRFAKTKDFSWTDEEISNFDINASSETNNKRFVNQSWLNKNSKVFFCPTDWYLGKMSGGIQGFDGKYHNVYKWTCGTIYNDYDNGDASFKWRYFTNNGSLCMQIITNIKIMVDPSDVSVNDFISENGQYIDFIFVYNLATNKMTINAKTSNDDVYVDVTNDCYIRNTAKTIECNYPLTEISIVQFTFDKSDEDIIEMYENGTLITKLPMYFTNMTMVQDTTLPKFYPVTWTTTYGDCNGTKLYTKTFEEGSELVHPTCSRLGFKATRFVESGNSSNIIIAGTPVTRRMIIEPVFEAVQYTVTFDNNTSDFAYIQCDGSFNTTASLNEVIASSKIPTCKGDGVIFKGWYDADKRKAGVNGIAGDITYLPSVEYPDYKLIFNVPEYVSCRECKNTKTFNRRNPIGALPIPFKDGYTFKGWYYDNAFTKPVHSTDKLVKDTTVYPRFVESVWTVNFIAPNGATITPYKSLQVKDAQTIGRMANNITASLPNYTLKGFYQISNDDVLSTTKLKSSIAVYNDMVFTAVFEDASGNTTYKKYSEAKAAGEITTNTDDSDTGYIPEENTNGSNDSNDNNGSNDNNDNHQPSNNPATPLTPSPSTPSTNTNPNNNRPNRAPSTTGTGTNPNNNRTPSTPSTNINPSTTSTPTYCLADAGFPQTDVGQTAEIACPKGTGKRTRKCNTGGVWGNEDISKCTDDKSTTESSSSTMMYIIIGVVIVVIIVIVLFMGKGGKTVVVQQPMGFAGM